MAIPLFIHLAKFALMAGGADKFLGTATWEDLLCNSGRAVWTGRNRGVIGILLLCITDDRIKSRIKIASKNMDFSLLICCEPFCLGG